MAELTIIEPVVGESANLELHTELCAQRYNQLIDKFAEVDNRLGRIEFMLTDIHNKLGSINTERMRTLISWAGIAIMTLVTFTSGLISYIVTRI
jgi:hypothetical protein